ncbi:MAG: type II toxin-antitoxin system PemK/MazF family toxin [Arcobacteraceae bacterium]|jgi:mRNA-degrading endonuclease toxin of MazEF toxin-antitoxin module|nr:type II toxin-antitoxin system PemK/MazF family toxin [Arcobacteraceae bacterium]
MFNKKIKLYDIEVGSLVWVEFGETKHLFLNKMEREFKEECFNLNDCPHGLNLLHEFSYYHMAFLLTNKLNKVVAVVPITEYKDRDDNYHDTNIILNKNDFGLNLIKKSTVKLDQLRFIDKTRIVKVERKYINKSLKHLLLKKVQGLF